MYDNAFPIFNSVVLVYFIIQQYFNLYYKKILCL